MTQSQTPEGGQETGGEFRQKFEATKAENETLRSMVATQVAARFEHVSVDDLAGVDVTELEAKASAVHEQRQAERTEIVREAYKKVGLSDDQITELLAGSGSPQAPAPTQTAPSVVEQVGSLGGSPVTFEKDVSQMSPREKIAHGISQRSR